MIQPLPARAQVQRCVFCNQHISMLYTRSGKKFPFEPLPVDLDNLGPRVGWIPGEWDVKGVRRTVLAPMNNYSGRRQLGVRRAMVVHQCPEYRKPTDERPPCPCVLCSHIDLDALSPQQRLLSANARAYGWTVINVEGADQPPHSHTVALWHLYRVPDLCIFGLDAETATDILDTAARMTTNGKGFPSGSRQLDLLAGDYEMAVINVDVSWHAPLFPRLLTFYGGERPPVQQLIWPDAAGRFQWEADVTASHNTTQPLLWYERHEHPIGMWA